MVCVLRPFPIVRRTRSLKVWHVGPPIRLRTLSG
jgi:hypothetical protein